MSPEVASKLAMWRQKAIDNTLTQDDMKEAIRIMRGDRVGAAIASSTSRRAKAKAEIPKADDLLAELGL